MQVKIIAEHSAIRLTFIKLPLVIKVFVIPGQSQRDIVLASSVHSDCPSTLFVRLEPYLNTYWSDLIYSWYK